MAAICGRGSAVENNRSRPPPPVCGNIAAVGITVVVLQLRSRKVVEWTWVVGQPGRDDCALLLGGDKVLIHRVGAAATITSPISWILCVLAGRASRVSS